MCMHLYQYVHKHACTFYVDCTCRYECTTLSHVCSTCISDNPKSFYAIVLSVFYYLQNSIASYSNYDTEVALNVELVILSLVQVITHMLNGARVAGTRWCKGGQGWVRSGFSGSWTSWCVYGTFAGLCGLLASKQHRETNYFFIM